MSEPIKINIKRDDITLEVNDQGDTIVLPVSDERFNKRLYEFADKISEDKTYDVLPEDSISVKIDKDLAFHEMLRTEFDVVFGSGAYAKVFGEDTVIGAEYVLEFIIQCLPYIEKHNNNRLNRISKYNPNRVGSSL